MANVRAMEGRQPAVIKGDVPSLTFREAAALDYYSRERRV